jgi:hypothetical protein
LSALQACLWGWASRLHQTSSSKPSAMSGWLTAIGISRSRRFFSLVGRVGTDHPVFGAWPTDPQANDGIQHRRACEGGVAQALLVTDFGQPFERPHTRRLTEVPGALVQDGVYLLSFLSVQHGFDPDRHVRPTRHTREATHVKRVNDVPHRLRAQRKVRAICEGCWPSVLAHNIWQRRTVKASRLRHPASSAARSSSGTWRIDSGGFIAQTLSPCSCLHKHFVQTALVPQPS